MIKALEKQIQAFETVECGYAYVEDLNEMDFLIDLNTQPYGMGYDNHLKWSYLSL